MRIEVGRRLQTQALAAAAAAARRTPRAPAAAGGGRALGNEADADAAGSAELLDVERVDAATSRQSSCAQPAVSCRPRAQCGQRGEREHADGGHELYRLGGGRRRPTASSAAPPAAAAARERGAPAADADGAPADAALAALAEVRLRRRADRQRVPLAGDRDDHHRDEHVCGEQLQHQLPDALWRSATRRSFLRAPADVQRQEDSFDEEAALRGARPPAATVRAPPDARGLEGGVGAELEPEPEPEPRGRRW